MPCPVLAVFLLELKPLSAISIYVLLQTLILNAQNVRMNVFYLPDYSMHNTVAFVPAMSVGSGKVAQVSHLFSRNLPIMSES